MRNFLSCVDDISLIHLENFLITTFVQTTQDSWIGLNLESSNSEFMKKPLVLNIHS